MCPQTARSRSRSANSRRHSAIMSPKRSNGTIMSAAVFEIAGSRLLRQRHAAIDAGRHRFAQLRERRGARPIGRQRNLGVVEHAMAIEQPAEAHQRRIGRRRIARGLELRPESSASSAGSSRSISKHHRRARRQRDLELAIDAVLADHGDRSRVEVLDRGDVDAARIARTPGLDATPGAARPSSAIAAASVGTGTSARHRPPGSGAVLKITSRDRRRACLRSR